MKQGIYTMGVDVGSSYIKTVLMDYSDEPQLLDKRVEKIRKRNPSDVADEMVNQLFDDHGLVYEDIAYLASTGEGEMVRRKKGHFYSMTTHSRGGHFLQPEAKTVVDMGALYVRAIKVDQQAKVMDYKMTGQCASGSGQFIENISRYLGLSVEEVGDVSIQSQNPEVPSGICAVLAETDVINMVSRGIKTPDIIKGIHLSVGSRIIKLLSSLKAETPVMLAGGLAANHGMVEAIKELLAESKYDFDVITHPDAIYSGAIGAALWGGYRYEKLNQKQAVQV